MEVRANDDDAADWLSELVVGFRSVPTPPRLMYWPFVADSAAPAAAPAAAPTPSEVDAAPMLEQPGSSSSSFSAARLGKASPDNGDICYFLLAKSCKAGNVLAHVRKSAIAVLEKFKNRGEPVMLKFGVTSDPEHRWLNSAYGYKKEKWHKMYVLHRSHDVGSVLMLEAAAIALFEKESGLQNIALGGENPPKEMPCFFYLVVRGLPPPTSS